MPTPEHNILLYPELSPSERGDIERYVAAHPHLRSLLDEAKALTSLLEQMPTLDAPPNVQDIAQYVLGRHLDAHDLPEPLARRYAAIEKAIDADPALRRQARAMVKTLERVAAESEDPVAQFERLSGRRLEPTPQTTEVIAPISRLYRLRPLRLALAASLSVIVLYGALVGANYAVTPSYMRAAALDDVTQVNAGMTLRGAGPSDQTLELYATALDRVKSARSSTLGLFASYDYDQLDLAAVDLRRVIDESEEGSWEALEALYVLGKIRVYQNRADDALWALQAVVSMDGPHSSNARRLIDFLQSQEP